MDDVVEPCIWCALLHADSPLRHGDLTAGRPGSSRTALCRPALAHRFFAATATPSCAYQQHGRHDNDIVRVPAGGVRVSQQQKCASSQQPARTAPFAVLGATMVQLPHWHSVEVSAGSRPVLREGELDVITENNIGLYQGKSKILERQNGRVYLTTQRLIYIDNVVPQNSLSIDLNDVESIDYTTKFLKSSPKIIIFLKPYVAEEADKKEELLNWACEICSFNNTMNTSHDESVPLVCENCGVKSLKSRSELMSLAAKAKPEQVPTTAKKQQIECAACTFLNHPSLRHCEICGNPLQNSNANSLIDDRIKIKIKTESPIDLSTPFIKISFHKQGDKMFYEKLNETLNKFKWNELVKQGKVNKNSVNLAEFEINKLIQKDSMVFGIQSLAMNQSNQTLKNEIILNNSINDLKSLISKANEISTLIDSFNKLSSTASSSSTQLTKLKQTIFQKFNVEELARKISEFLINDGILNQQGGIISLIDLYVLYNKENINLVSPEELFEACGLFDKLNLPLIFKKINNLYIIQDINFTNVKLIGKIKKFIRESSSEEFQYSTILKISEYFNWSLMITEELLLIGIELGEFWIDDQLSGRNYYISYQEVEHQQSIFSPKTVDSAAISSPKADSAAITSDTKDKAVKITDFDFPILTNNKLPDVGSESETARANTGKSRNLMQLEGLQF